MVEISHPFVESACIGMDARRSNHVRPEPLHINVGMDFEFVREVPPEVVVLTKAVSTTAGGQGVGQAQLLCVIESLLAVDVDNRQTVPSGDADVGLRLFRPPPLNLLWVGRGFLESVSRDWSVLRTGLQREDRKAKLGKLVS